MSYKNDDKFEKVYFYQYFKTMLLFLYLGRAGEFQFKNSVKLCWISFQMETRAYQSFGPSKICLSAKSSYF